jgi:hypothetical protein
MTTGKADAFLALHQTADGQWCSPFRATFGSIDADEHFDFTTFLNAINLALKSFEIEKIVLKPSPSYFQTKHLDMVSSVFNDTVIEYAELNYHLFLVNKTFESGLHKSKKWRLNKLLKSSYHFNKVENPDLKLIHTFIANARNRKGYPITITMNDFELLVKQFHNHYHFFEVKQGHKLAAVGVCVDLGKGVFYNFYSADSNEFSKDAPMLLLYKGMYDFAASQHYKVFDLGISTYLGSRNEGLIQFKKSLGAIETNKYILTVFSK